MIDLSKLLKCTTQRVNLNVKLWTSVNIMYPYWLISFLKSTIFMQDVSKRAWGLGSEGSYGSALLSPQFFYKPKTNPKNVY